MFAVRMLLPTSDCMICWRTQIQKIIAIPVSLSAAFGVENNFKCSPLNDMIQKL